MKETLYVHRPLLNATQLSAYAEALGLQNVMLPVEMHVTLAYSKDPVDWTNSVFIPDHSTVLVEGGERSIQRFGSAVVMVFDYRPFHQRWAQFIMAGASWDFPEYNAHVTLAYDDTAPVDGMMASGVPLKFGPERREQVNEEWKGTA
jgi:uncharacterized protein